MARFFENDICIVTLTFVAFFVAQLIQKKTRIILLNPILVAIIMIISFLFIFKIDFEVYHKGSRLIEFFLKPAIVALGVPLYQQLGKIKKQAVPILVSQLVGCLVGVVSVVLIAKWMGAPRDIILSLAPKSVTTPIAMEVSKTIGGIPPLTASVVILVGIFGSIFGYGIMKFSRVKSTLAQGISMGTAAHVVGTSKSMEISENYGVMSSIGLIVNGILTALLAPYILQLLHYCDLF
ncbi:CidB/LrgB family autolysis modulator [Wenyingzhuangia fucanilytica]|uniref:CidB/LrgB family autolysis modulator n=1 Tax=Wenyingzhuangia fucanilytica TaxID=1790137 RepID=A0A1B1Y580_9FLAO|nr:LrgB family protein [Wenyingzhuangia fucanilytica]ANW95910.1 CidB/LrgB family autolysis modulator [Wenyingzhuangia fucanilytica]